MKKMTKWLVLSPMLIVASASLTSCDKGDNYLELRVINSEDYIYLNDPTDPESLPDLVTQFENSDMVRDFLNTYYPGMYKGVRVIYDTSDTNETLYSELQTGKSNYDLMNVSDYMAQKIVSSGLAVPLYQHGQTIPYYQQYASSYIKGRLDEIEAGVVWEYDEVEGKMVQRVLKLEDYAVGYMWGTLGILFNPTYSGFNGLPMDTVISDMQSYSALWDSKYNGTISIKNSMRDTYALGVLYTYRNQFAAYKEELDAAKEAYEAGEISKDDYDKAVTAYQTKFSKLFNCEIEGRSFESVVDEVRGQLEILKENIFGLEVDSGKQDIITKKIGVNLAWSGDAVYSMDQGEDLTQVSSLVELYYSVPELGSNLWFDAWIMPNCDRTFAQYQLAHLFLNFLSDPENANQNMTYTGYTSFIGGDSIVGLVRDWYDVRTEEVYFDDYQIYSVGPNPDDKPHAIDFSVDFFSDRGDTRNDDFLYAFVPFIDTELEEPELIEEPRSRKELIDNSEIVPSLDEDGEIIFDDNDEIVQKKYSELLIVDNDEYAEVDLSYFFEGTLNELNNPRDTFFYAEEYLYELEGEDNVSVGRQFFCQYPDLDTITRCAVMQDYGTENNKLVMKMWEEFKSDPLPIWAIITFSIIGAAAIGFVALLIINNILKKSTKKKRIAK